MSLKCTSEDPADGICSMLTPKIGLKDLFCLLGEKYYKSLIRLAQHTSRTQFLPAGPTGSVATPALSLLGTSLLFPNQESLALGQR